MLCLGAPRILPAAGGKSNPWPNLILVSPAIGVSAAAAIAGPTATLGRVPGFGRLAWAQTTPEFDPYKYNSFPVNAGAQVHKLTRYVSNRVNRLVSSGRAAELPPILVFKSAVDATVSTDALVDRLLQSRFEKGRSLWLFGGGRVGGKHQANPQNQDQ